jgi:hypothetical protein
MERFKALSAAKRGQALKILVNSAPIRPKRTKRGEARRTAPDRPRKAGVKH